MTFGLTPFGFNAKRLADIKQDLDNAMIAQFGDVNLDPQSVFGQIIGVMAKPYADDWENMNDVYFSQYPNSASGVSLDNVVQLNGLTRLPAAQTQVIGVCTGQELTTIPAASLVRVANTNNTFSNQVSGLITRDVAYSVIYAVSALAAQAYTVIINNVLYTYSLPIITFTGGFVWDNSIVVRLNQKFLTAVPYTNMVSVCDFDIDFDTGNLIQAQVNGVNLTLVPFNTDQATTLSDLATNLETSPDVGSAAVTGLKQITVTFLTAGNNTVNSITTTGGATQPVETTTDAETTIDAIAAQIALEANVLSATVVGGNEIDIVPNVGFSVNVTSITITGGVSQATYAVTFDTPTENGISQNLSAILNAANINVTSTDLTGTFSVTSVSPEISFAASFLTGLLITSQSSPVTFFSVDFGPVPCPANSLTEIITPISGWDSITNPTAGINGRFIETDSELRIRRARSIALSGNATVEAIRAHLLQDVPGVTSALVFENTTVRQAETDIVFASALITGNTVTIEINGRFLPTITYATSNAATMNQLAIMLKAQPEIDDCVVAGAGNNILEITVKIFQEVIIDGVTITGGASQTTSVVKGGRPPKSFEAVVSGGTDLAVAEEIWLSKPAGIATFGNVNNGNGIEIIDSQGFTQVIFFSRPTPIYIWVQVSLSLYTEETFPTNGLQLVQEAILNYGNSLGIGVDVLIQRVLCQIFTVPGVSGGTITIAATNNPGDTPSYATNDIPIGEAEISNWDLSRILVTL